MIIKWVGSKYTDKFRRSISEGHSDFTVMAMENNQRGETLMALSISCASINYTQQPVVSLYILSIHDKWSTIDNSFKDIINQIKQPVVIQSIDYIGNNVGVYVSFVRLCYLLLQQRKHLSRGLIKYNCISTKAISDTEHIVSILNKNKSMDGLYKNVSLFQKREAHQWFGEKDKV